MGAYAERLKQQKVIDNILAQLDIDDDDKTSLSEAISDIVEEKVTAALTAATNEDGMLTEWADGRYEPKSVMES